MLAISWVSSGAKDSTKDLLHFICPLNASKSKWIPLSYSHNYSHGRYSINQYLIRYPLHTRRASNLGIVLASSSLFFLQSSWASLSPVTLTSVNILPRLSVYHCLSTSLWDSLSRLLPIFLFVYLYSPCHLVHPLLLLPIILLKYKFNFVFVQHDQFHCHLDKDHSH